MGCVVMNPLFSVEIHYNYSEIAELYRTNSKPVSLYQGLSGRRCLRLRKTEVQEEQAVRLTNWTFI